MRVFRFRDVNAYSKQEQEIVCEIYLEDAETTYEQKQCECYTLDECRELGPSNSTTTTLVASSTTSSTSDLAMATAPSAATTAASATAQGIRSFSVYAGNAFATFEINGVKIGSKGGGEKFDISLRENESIYYMQYGINRWDTANEWTNAICSLKIGTNFQEYGPYHEARVLKLNAIVKKLQF